MVAIVVQMSALRGVKPFSSPRTLVVQVQAGERLRLNNLSPAPGSKRDKQRKGRGYAAGQVR